MRFPFGISSILAAALIAFGIVQIGTKRQASKDDQTVFDRKATPRFDANRIAEMLEEEQRVAVPEPPPKPSVSGNHYPQADPYADTVAAARTKEAKQQWEIFLDNLRVIYFAVGCDIFSEQDAQPLISERFAYFISRPWIQWNRKVMDEARLQGLAKSKIANACSFWHDNPQNLLDMRREAQAAISRVIAGYNPPLATDETPLPLSIK